MVKISISVCVKVGPFETHPAVVPTSISELACCLQSARFIGYDEGISSIDDEESILNHVQPILTADNRDDG
jgi:hypothetical protein